MGWHRDGLGFTCLPLLTASLLALLVVSVLAAVKATSSNSDDNKVIRLAHYYLQRLAPSVSKDLVQAYVSAPGTAAELTDPYLARSMSALAAYATAACSLADRGESGVLG